MQFRYNSNRTSPVQAIGGLLILAVFIIGMFLVARFIFRILAFLAPALIIAALILDYRTVTGFFKWLWSLVKQNTLMGIGAIVLTILGFPLVSAFLAGKALLSRNVRQAKKEYESRKEGEYIEFEELDSETMELPELSEMEERRKPKDRPQEPSRDDKYDQFFND